MNVANTLNLSRLFSFFLLLQGELEVRSTNKNMYALVGFPGGDIMLSRGPVLRSRNLCFFLLWRPLFFLVYPTFLYFSKIY